MSDPLMTIPALRAAVLVPVLLGVQRQLPEERAGVPDPVRPGFEEATANTLVTLTAARLHRPVLLPVRPRRPDRRSLRQGDHRAARETRRDRRLGARRRRLLAALRADHVRHAVPVRRHRDAVRADQIRHPPRSSEEGRAARRQCAGRRRDLHGDPARHHRRRLAAKEGVHPVYFAVADLVFSLRLLGIEPADPATTGQGAPNLCVDRNIARSTGSLLKDLWIDNRLWWGGLVTSWFWLVGAVALSLMPPLVKGVLGAAKTSSPRISRSSRSRSRSARCLRPGSRMAASCCSRRWSAHFCSRSSRSTSALPPGRADRDRRSSASREVFSSWQGHPHRDRPCWPCDRGRPVHRAVVRRRPVLGRRRQARPRGRRRQRAQCGVHRRRHADRRGAAGLRPRRCRNCSS